MEKMCEVCNKQYETKSHKSRYCCVDCRRKASNLGMTKKEKKQCKNCGNDFFGHQGKLFCCTSCYKDFNWNKDERRKYWARTSYHKCKSKDWKKYLLKYAKARSVKKNLPFDITEKDIVIPDRCVYFDKEFILFDRKWGPSIDQIIPGKGYTKDNIQIISCLANKMKWDSSEEEILAFARGVIRKHKRQV